MSYDDLLRESLGHGCNLPKAMEFLRAAGASPAEAARSVAEVTGLGDELARQTVRDSRAWSGPRSGMQLAGERRSWYGAIGQHGRSGHGASSVLPHLGRKAQTQAQHGTDQPAG
ncbi:MULTISPECIES: hypothetical protein [Ramlibacter]|uniref:Uncharacterized protein n=1 Tax=Ramlibacter pinisoli TaxID=2682844 RepID=A0A6N8IT85_9BURK|nr:MULTISPECIES: hypothetical protein [Ramlibacter]MBA2964967.1 hypothetical protein [Ramlibacter sp. CGMCC 1.13660]MVQ29932.1 hypothetical protein [Ramlibacter pinisoli]